MNLINMLPETNGKFHLLLHEVSEFPLQPQQWEYIKADETRLYQIIDTSRRLRSRIKEIKIIPKGHTCAQQHAEQDSARTRTAPPPALRASGSARDAWSLAGGFARNQWLRNAGRQWARGLLCLQLLFQALLLHGHMGQRQRDTASSRT